MYYWQRAEKNDSFQEVMTTPRRIPYSHAELKHLEEGYRLMLCTTQSTQKGGIHTKCSYQVQKTSINDIAVPEKIRQGWYIHTQNPEDADSFPQNTCSDQKGYRYSCSTQSIQVRVIDPHAHTSAVPKGPRKGHTLPYPKNPEESKNPLEVTKSLRIAR